MGIAGKCAPGMQIESRIKSFGLKHKLEIIHAVKVCSTLTDDILMLHHNMKSGADWQPDGLPWNNLPKPNWLNLHLHRDQTSHEAGVEANLSRH